MRRIRVVRLKGGDPAIFGRLAEEIEAVRTAGIAFEIVPGITTASAAVASSKIPLTERGQARRVQFVTAHARAGSALALDWAGLADPECTLVFYMGRAAANEIAKNLLSHGLPGETPVLLMSDVSRPSEQRAIVLLSNLAEGASRLPSGPPMIAIIGNVARLAVAQEGLAQAQSDAA